jgi:DNA invertase Pin-like site-specific DNA recombinase
VTPSVSFVAVTQQFNTTTSMGRLTLNVLLSFAQFERELPGERIRDKFAASRRRILPFMRAVYARLRGVWSAGVMRERRARITLRSMRATARAIGNARFSL